MNIMQFIDEYEASANKKNYVEKHITKRYLPFETKVAVAKSIINNSMYATVGDKRIFRPDSPCKHMCTTMAIVQNYTDIELNNPNNNEVTVGEQNLISFNLLEESGATKTILETIGMDVMKFQNIITLVLQDTMDMERNLVPFLDTKIEAWQMAMETLGTTLQEVQAKQDE